MGSSRLFSSAWLLSGRSHAQVFFVLLPTSCPAGLFFEEGARSLAEISHFLKGKKVELAPPPSIPRMKTNGLTERVENCGKAGAVVLSDNFFLPSFLPPKPRGTNEERERGSAFFPPFCLRVFLGNLLQQGDYFVVVVRIDLFCCRIVSPIVPTRFSCYSSYSVFPIFPDLRKKVLFPFS